MFYSHEILTRREHGVATIWLVATLGSRSSLKKVTRKAINDVNVPKAVQTILSPDAPMALRLQGNLLYGVSRVYSQQCNYAHQDLQSFWDKLQRSTLIFGREGMELDPEAGRVRPEQLNLQDDPAFIPGFNIDLDLSLFDIPFGCSSSRASSHLPSLAGSSHASLGDHEPQLEFPCEDTPGFGIGGFDFGAGTSSIGQPGANIQAPSIFDEPGIIDDPDFVIDADGNFFTPTQRQRQSEVAQEALTSLGVAGSKAGDSTGITDRVKADHEAGLQGEIDDQIFDFDDQPVFVGNDELPLPEAAPFSARQPSTALPAGKNRQSSSVHSDEASSIIHVAPQRRVRAKPAIKVDLHTQIKSNDLKAWDDNYVLNMAKERLEHAHVTSTLPQSKKNAEHFVLGIGLSGLGREFDSDLEHPLRQAFSGKAFFDTLTGKETSPAGKKRSHTSDEDEDEEDEDGRRVRPRSGDDQEVARGGDKQYQFDDNNSMFVQGNEDVPIEVGRNAPPSIPDIDSVRNSMPWNALISSRTGSARPVGYTSSAAGRLGGFDLALGPPSTQGHRVTSASPLLGRGKQSATRYSSLEIPGQDQPSGDVGTFDDDGFQLPDLGDEEFELHGPAAGVSTQQANNSEWLANTLEDEANNFFAFLQAELEKRSPVLEKAESQDLGSDGDGIGRGTVTFEELLPPESNSKVVGAQGLLHVLTLVTRGAVTVKQQEDFGEIEMSIVPGVRLVEREEDDREQEGDVIDVDDLEAEEPVQDDEADGEDMYH